MIGMTAQFSHSTWRLYFGFVFGIRWANVNRSALSPLSFNSDINASRIPEGLSFYEIFVRNRRDF